MVLTNKDKYLKDGVDVVELARNLYHYFEEEGQNYPCNIVNFFDKPIKQTLTEDEKVILRNIEFKDYMVIGRKKSGDLYVNDKENDSFNGTWFIMFKKHLFQFIKPRRRI